MKMDEFSTLPYRVAPFAGRCENTVEKTYTSHIFTILLTSKNATFAAIL